MGTERNNSCESLRKPRTVLGDLTNQLSSKRPRFSDPNDDTTIKGKTVNPSNLTIEESAESFNYDSDDGDGFVMSQSGSMDCNFLYDSSQESKLCVNDCSCSFCTKAARIWLDLNYQDIKARVSVTTRIQKEAILLSERIGRRHGVERSTRVGGLESDLRQHWRSLFQNMAGIWEKEGHQLEASLLPVAELREKLKTELELIATPSEKN